MRYTLLVVSLVALVSLTFARPTQAQIEVTISASDMTPFAVIDPPPSPSGGFRYLWIWATERSSPSIEGISALEGILHGSGITVLGITPDSSVVNASSGLDTLRLAVGACESLPLPRRLARIAVLDSAGTLELIPALGGTSVLGADCAFQEAVCECVTFNSAGLSQPGQPASTLWSEAFGDQSLGGGGVGGAGDTVLALASFGGDLYAGGEFDSAGNTLLTSLARWDGSLTTGSPAQAVWQSVGAGLSGVNPSSPSQGRVQVRALFPHPPSNNIMYVGGRFINAGGVVVNSVASWDGTTWRAIGSGVQKLNGKTANVRSLTVHAGQPYVGGDFLRLGDAVTECRRVARRNPLTSELEPLWNSAQTEQGVGGDSSDGTSVVNALLTLADGRIVVGGVFSIAGGVPVKNVAVWDPTDSTWAAMGDGLGDPATSGAVLALQRVNGTPDIIVAGGTFEVSGVTQVNGLARWDGSAWVPLDERGFYLGPTGVYSLFIENDGTPNGSYDADLFVGGTFGSILASGSLAVQPQANNVALFRDPVGGSSSHPYFAAIGDGLDQSGVVRACTWHDGSAYFGGVLAFALGGIPSVVGSRNIAGWSAGLLTVDAPPAAPFGSAAFAFEEPYPNPFRGSSRFSLTLRERADDVLVEVFDVAGRRVAVVFEGSLERGTNRFEWTPPADGAIASGVLFVRARANGQTVVRRTVLLR